MIVKEFTTQDDIDRLRKLASDHPAKKAVIDRQIKFLNAGTKAEREAAHYLDHDFGASPNWAVVHGLRLEYGGRVAQIDHLLVNRHMIFVLLETKNFSSGVAVQEDGSFVRFVHGSRSPVGMASPFAQNARHALVLDQFLRETDILPKRLGMRLGHTTEGFVLVNPSARITRPKEFDTTRLMGADQLRGHVDRMFAGMGVARTFGNLATLVSSETMEGVARRLVAMHVPIEIDYEGKFGIEKPAEEPVPSVAEIMGLQSPDATKEVSSVGEVSVDPVAEEGAGEPRRSKLTCASCGTKVDISVARFCWFNKPRFGGDVYCREHQAGFPPVAR